MGDVFAAAQFNHLGLHDNPGAAQPFEVSSHAADGFSPAHRLVHWRTDWFTAPHRLVPISYRSSQTCLLSPGRGAAVVLFAPFLSADARQARDRHPPLPPSLPPRASLAPVRSASVGGRPRKAPVPPRDPPRRPSRRPSPHPQAAPSGVCIRNNRPSGQDPKCSCD